MAPRICCLPYSKHRRKYPIVDRLYLDTWLRVVNAGETDSGNNQRCRTYGVNTMDGNQQPHLFLYNPRDFCIDNISDLRDDCFLFTFVHAGHPQVTQCGKDFALKFFFGVRCNKVFLRCQYQCNPLFCTPSEYRRI